MLKSTDSGFIIFSTELLPSSIPIIKIKKDTIKAEIYSILPCPKGCSSSTGLLASFVPAMVMIPEPASDRLFTASAVMDTAPVSVPIRNFTAHSRRLHAIPNVPLKTPSFSRDTAGLHLCFFIDLSIIRLIIAVTSHFGNCIIFSTLKQYNYVIYYANKDLYGDKDEKIIDN